MHEKTTKILAVAVALIGLVLLFFVSNNLETTGLAIKEINLDKEGETVKACGQISGKRVSNNHIFLDLQDSTGTIRIVIFNTTSLKLNASGISVFSIKNGRDICVTGFVDEFPAGSGKTNLVYRKSDLEK